MARRSAEISKSMKPSDTVTKDNAETSESNMCHQCQRNDKGHVVRCQNCKKKRYCFPCLYSWCSHISKENIAKKCPFCCYICKCTQCLRRGDTHMEGFSSDHMVSRDETIQCSKYIFRRLLPYMKEINDEQIAEKELEAKIFGLEFGEVKPQDAICLREESLYCDICKALIFDLHRSCSSCSSDICLTCCLEIRSGKLQACQENVSWSYINFGRDFTHGEGVADVETTNDKLIREDHVKLSSMWKAKEAGSITFYCGASDLELKRILPNDWVSNVVKKVEKTVEASKLLDLPETVMEQCPCFDSKASLGKKGACGCEECA
ncbi:hypothetical protein AALP_AA1G280400 [Arabis alpina]|uniref:RING-type domain-containing protein n=1 Tax=Arabis alpina TaxID=50452 RepID=A0A087HR51_ARAAL|nr:hypothetical protein AALP_AA1G280400 [Arabis alpina]